MDGTTGRSAACWLATLVFRQFQRTCTGRAGAQPEWQKSRVVLFEPRRSMRLDMGLHLCPMGDGLHASRLLGPFDGARRCQVTSRLDLGGRRGVAGVQLAWMQLAPSPTSCCGGCQTDMLRCLVGRVFTGRLGGSDQLAQECGG